MIHGLGRRGLIVATAVVCLQGPAPAQGPQPAPGGPGPVMQAMGLEKAFAFVLHVSGPDRVAIEIRYVDTRTPARTEMSFLTFDLRRASRRVFRQGS